MSMAGWLSPNKNSGSGNDTVVFSALSQNTGRNARSTNGTFSAADVQDVVVVASQAGKPEFVSLQASAAVSKDGTLALTLSGTTNSSKLTFALGQNNTLPLTLPATYLANSVQTNNGEAISGDPGASSEFHFSITFENIPANTEVEALVAQVIVTDNAGHTSTCTVTQAAGDATLSVSPLTVELPWDASTTVSVSVTSNTNWELS
jgi:hypothetical protein